MTCLGVQILKPDGLGRSLGQPNGRPVCLCHALVFSPAEWGHQCPRHRANRRIGWDTNMRNPTRKQGNSIIAVTRFQLTWNNVHQAEVKKMGIIEDTWANNFNTKRLKTKPHTKRSLCFTLVSWLCFVIVTVAAFRKQAVMVYNSEYIPAMEHCYLHGPNGDWWHGFKKWNMTRKTTPRKNDHLEWNKDFHIYKTTSLIQNSNFTNSFQHWF